MFSIFHLIGLITFWHFYGPQSTPSRLIHKHGEKNDRYPATPGTNKPYIYLKLNDGSRGEK